MEKPDPYGEWVLFGTNQEAGEKPLPVDEDLLAAARETWPHVLAHARRELSDKESGPDRTALQPMFGRGCPFGCKDPPT